MEESMRRYIIASVFVIIGLLAMFFKGKIPDPTAAQFFGDLSSAILVSGLLSLLVRIFQDRESEYKLRKLLKIHNSIIDLGLEEIKTNVQAYDYSDIILNSKELNIVMNDGLRWVGNNTVQLRKRFSQETTTNFFLVDPESEFVTVLANKVDTTTEKLKEKIKDTWAKLKEAYTLSERHGKLNIYCLKTYPTKSIFLSDDFLIETPYQTSCGRVNIPLFIYKKSACEDSLYRFVEMDIKALKKESRLIDIDKEI